MVRPYPVRVRGDGDGWVFSDGGGRYWGRHGAAGKPGIYAQVVPQMPSRTAAIHAGRPASRRCGLHEAIMHSAQILGDIVVCRRA